MEAVRPDRKIEIRFNVKTPAAELPPDMACRAVLGKSIWQIADEIILKEAKKRNA